MNHKLTRTDLAAIQAEVEARVGEKPTAENFTSSSRLQTILDGINGFGRTMTLLTAEVVQALAALIIAIVFAVLEFQRVESGAIALEQPAEKAALIAFAVVTANIVHPIYALREMRGRGSVTVKVGTLRGAVGSFINRIVGEPVTKEIDAYHNPTLHVAAAVITWSTVLLAVYDILGPLLKELFGEGGLQRPVAIALVELIAGLGLSSAAQGGGAALVDLQLYRAQLRRILRATLYFIEVRAANATLHKIGVTARPLEQRMAEIRADLAPHFGQTLLIPLGTWAHRGNVEMYFKHRYSRCQNRLGSLTEYFAFEDLKPVLRDLRRMKPKELSDFDRKMLGEGGHA